MALLSLKSLIEAGIIPGIKVDTGAKDMAGHAGEKVTEGLDGLRDRLAEYFQMGARFAKWRAVIADGRWYSQPGLHRGQRARVGSLCRVMPGSRTGSSGRTGGAHGRRTYHGALLRGNGGGSAYGFQPALLPTRDAGGIDPEAQHGASGIDLPQAGNSGRSGRRTVKCLLRAVPAAVPGIAFLSGGQSGELASARLNAMNVRFKSQLPWALAFSFARAIQQPALEIWHGEQANVPAAQQALHHRAQCNRAARRGEYNAALDTDGLESALRSADRL